jgi:hypothetical protein
MSASERAVVTEESGIPHDPWPGPRRAAPPQRFRNTAALARPASRGRWLHRAAAALDAFPRSDPQSRVTLRAAGRPAGGPHSEHCALDPLDHRRKVSAVRDPRNAAGRRQQPRAFDKRAALGPRRAARARAALDRAAARAGPVRAEPQLGRRDLSGDRAGPPARLRLRHCALGISARHAVLDLARGGRRADAALAPDRRRTGLLSAADCRRLRASRHRAGCVLLSMGAPLVWTGRRARRRISGRGRAGAHLFRRPGADRGRRRAYPRSLPAGCSIRAPP